MKIGILKCGPFPEEMQSHHGDYTTQYSRLLAGQGFTFQSWNVTDMDLPTAVHQAEGWLVSGSRYGAYEELPWIPPLEDFIRAVYADGRPMVGICFGHQIIAQALGGRVEKFADGWAVGATEYEIEGQPYRLNAWHQDQVVEVPSEAKVVGGNAFCENAALVYGSKVFTMQPHPEFEDDFIDGLITYRGQSVAQDRIDAARAGIGVPNQNQAMADRIGAFFYGTTPQ